MKQILADEFKRATFGEARNAQEALNLVWKESWDVAVLDITMPGRSGLEVLREIKKSRPKLPVLVLSMHPENQFAVRVLKRGASGYMTKESAPDELVGAIKKVLGGGRYVSPSLAEKLASYLSSDQQKPPQELLSDREFQVLRLIASGKIVSEIARELSLSVKTISTYRTRILEKMDLRNNAELMHYAAKVLAFGGAIAPKSPANQPRSRVPAQPVLSPMRNFRASNEIPICASRQERQRPG